MSIIYLNGQYVPDTEAKISIFDRSYLFGEGLFESFRSFDGKIPFIQDHLNRLEWSSTFLNLQLPEDNLSQVCYNLLQKNNIKDARFKILLSRQTKSFGPDSKPGETDLENAQANLTVFCEQIDESLEETTIRLKTIKNYKNDTLPLASMKTSNYLTKIMALFEAHDAGYEDGVLVNSHGHVTETCTGNIFWVDKDSQLFTVIEDQGFLPGITKNNLMKLLKENKINIKSKVITPNDLSHSREIFITNSIYGLRPVTSVDSRIISGGDIGSITAMLRDLWAKHMKTLLEN